MQLSPVSQPSLSIHLLRLLELNCSALVVDKHCIDPGLLTLLQPILPELSVVLALLHHLTVLHLPQLPLVFLFCP